MHTGQNTNRRRLQTKDSRAVGALLRHCQVLPQRGQGIFCWRTTGSEPERSIDSRAGCRPTGYFRHPASRTINRGSCSKYNLEAGKHAETAGTQPGRNVPHAARSRKFPSRSTGKQRIHASATRVWAQNDPPGAAPDFAAADFCAITEFLCSTD